MGAAPASHSTPPTLPSCHLWWSPSKALPIACNPAPCSLQPHSKSPRFQFQISTQMTFSHSDPSGHALAGLTKPPPPFQSWCLASPILSALTLLWADLSCQVA